MAQRKKAISADDLGRLGIPGFSRDGGPSSRWDDPPTHPGWTKTQNVPPGSTPVSGGWAYRTPDGQLVFPGGGGNAMPVSKPYSLSDPYAEMMERMSEAMAQQAAMQAEYMNQMALLQEEQLRMQEEAAKAAMVENKKNPSDYAQANADDTARKQLLRRGLMSTFTRYGNANAGGGKATKLGG